MCLPKTLRTHALQITLGYMLAKTYLPALLERLMQSGALKP
jgi:hypothetical protein